MERDIMMEALAGSVKGMADVARVWLQESSVVHIDRPHLLKMQCSVLIGMSSRGAALNDFLSKRQINNNALEVFTDEKTHHNEAKVLLKKIIAAFDEFVAAHGYQPQQSTIVDEVSRVMDIGECSRIVSWQIPPHVQGGKSIEELELTNQVKTRLQEYGFSTIDDLCLAGRGSKYNPWSVSIGLYKGIGDRTRWKIANALRDFGAVPDIKK